MKTKGALDDMSQTEKIAYYLDYFGKHQPIQIVSGPVGGDNRATVEEFTWKVNARAVILALAKARQQGKRWAIAVLKIDTDRHPIEPGIHQHPGCNLETGDIVGFQLTEEPTDETTPDQPTVKTI